MFHGFGTPHAQDRVKPMPWPGGGIIPLLTKEVQAVPASSIKILIIEDERDVRIYLANLLGANTYKALTAANVSEGLTLAHSENPALIVLDAMLPGDDAQRIYTELRCQTGLCRIPVVVLSTITRRALRGSRLYGRESAGKGYAAAAASLVAGYVRHSGDTAVYGLLPFYKCYRAMVRTKVDCMRLRQGACRPAKSACCANRRGAIWNWPTATPLSSAGLGSGWCSA
jgi:CheY-like chemotaxis protein